MGNRHPWRAAVQRARHGKQTMEKVMYRMTLREQADVLERITAGAPSDTLRSAAIAAVRANRATALQVMEIHHGLQRWAERGTGLAHSEARRALEPLDDVTAGVRFYDAGTKS